MIGVRTVPNVMQYFGCTAQDATRYMDLRDEGYPAYQAAAMAGLADPHDPDLSPNERIKKLVESVIGCYGHHLPLSYEQERDIAGALSSLFCEVDAQVTGAYAEGRKDADAEATATVRDGFAAAALQALLARIDAVSGDYVTNAEPIDAARDSYKYADAMLKARQS